MRVLLAFDKFKDALTAEQACEFAARAIRQRHPDWTLDFCPIADGGEGFARILTRATGGETRSVFVAGPRGKPVEAEYGVVAATKISGPAAEFFGAKKPRGAIAIVELAAASGLALLDPAQRDPWHTSTFGTGELLRAAAESGANAILLGVGGSATNDLGLGALAALGFQFVSGADELVHPPVPARWKEIVRVRGEIAPALPPLFIACDVTNPLLGPTGAAAVFGPQKGLRPEDRRRLENESARLALMLCGHCGQPDTLMDAPGAGAAGGVPFGLMTALSAELLPGAELVSAWLDLDTRLAAADLVITGEGRFDESSLRGKGPGAIVSRALAFGLPVHVFAGTAELAHPRRGLELHSITSSTITLEEALNHAGENLAAAVATQL
jgi:glycerate kinase